MVVPQGVYVHLPFCARRCFYCDFPITVVGDRRTEGIGQWMATYTDYLCREIRATPPGDVPLTTLFFGGGTPSLLPVPLLAKIIHTLDQQFSWSPDREVSLEIDPGTFDREQLAAYGELGVNRYSLGVQSFQEHLLAACGRSHRLSQVYQAIEMFHHQGITNFSIDLISGLPHQTLEDWEFSLGAACDSGPAHLSCYDLVVESVTPFGKQYQPGKSPLPSDRLAGLMYETASQFLRDRGYGHYEISNYARPGFQSAHNRLYWENRGYHGFGMGAASYGDRIRLSRPRTRQAYFQWVERWERAQGNPRVFGDRLSDTDLLLERLMLGLRLTEGLSWEALTADFGPEVLPLIAQVLKPYGEKGWVNGENPDRLQLTDPQGLMFSNQILADLFAAIEESFEGVG